MTRPMSWKVMALVGACAGGVAWALSRRTTRRPDEEGQWAAATDRVEPASA